MAVSWGEFSNREPALARFGADRLAAAPSYLATVRRSGAPRVHPVTPIFTDVGLFLFMEPTSPKGSDLRERGWFALHDGVPDDAGSGGEFMSRVAASRSTREPSGPRSRPQRAMPPPTVTSCSSYSSARLAAMDTVTFSCPHPRGGRSNDERQSLPGSTREPVVGDQHRMCMRRPLVILGLAIAVSGCGGLDASNDGDGTTTPSTTNADQPVDSDGDQPIIEPGPPGSIPEPRPPIDGNVDGEVTITAADLRIMESFPVQIMLDVFGEKPTPCHEVFWTVDDDGEVITTEMISQIAPDQLCAQVIESFTIAVPLGSWADESREVVLNGEVVGSFES
jgi:hypothetical protein